MDEATESVILNALREGISLNTVNNYGENLLHIGAANGCSRIIREILKREKICSLDRRNLFGWTPLMQAIRNGKIDCVKILLANGASAAESNYLGMSAIGLATAVGKEMFEVVYKACPSALELTYRDEVCPLSISAMKNDKDMFFRLLELGFDLSKANDFTHFMLKSSTIPESFVLAKPPQYIESYWNDCTDNIEVLDESENSDIQKQKPNLPKIVIQDCKIEQSKHHKSETEKLSLRISEEEINEEYKSLISPILTYNFDGAFPPSPKPVSSRNKEMENLTNNEKETGDKFVFMENYNIICKLPSDFDRPLSRCQDIRPPDLEFDFESNDLNNTLSFIPEYSPTKSPNVPPQIEDENAVFGESTPTPPHGSAPPRAFILTPRDAPIAFLLHSYGLSHNIATFLEQEVDLELFLTLNNEDLEEIGIESEAERRILLAVIHDCKKRGVFGC